MRQGLATAEPTVAASKAAHEWVTGSPHFVLMLRADSIPTDLVVDQFLV